MQKRSMCWIHARQLEVRPFMRETRETVSWVGADPEVRDDEHPKPIDIAFEKGLTGIADILREVPLLLDVDVESDLEKVGSDASWIYQGLLVRTFTIYNNSIIYKC